jgi:CRISPR/Cas system-associated exonuclease Cas4 (RecB family)
MCYGGIPMKTLTASEIGSYLYCARAWWYRRNGVQSSNQAVMDAGSELHRQHGRQVAVSSLMKAAALISLLLALVLLVLFLVRQMG